MCLGVLIQSQKRETDGKATIVNTQYDSVGQVRRVLYNKYQQPVRPRVLMVFASYVNSRSVKRLEKSVNR
ncbi:hypothetical protein HZA73_12045 [candidate division TA06 bacterium]|nr:hypothetical protein [candidate division TA06 bacterium]